MLTFNKISGFVSYFINAILNSYGMLFFSKNKIFSLLILTVSMLTPYAGFAGFLALLVAIIAATALGFSKNQLETGLQTYSVVLFGLGLGSNFEYNLPFFILLGIGALLTLFLSTVLNNSFNKKGLPALSLAFILSTALIIVATKSFEGIGLTHRRIYWFNETYALGGTPLVNMILNIENWPFPDMVAGFFRSISAILFQVNIASGIILAIGLFIYSRIGFVLMLYGYMVALIFSYAMGGFAHTFVNYYNMGTNYMLVAVALGGFFLIPSVRSFLWILVTVPIAYLMVTGVGSIMFKIGVPVFSLPFCFTVILFLYMLQLRKGQQKLIVTPVQYYSPEVNLYRYLNGRERLFNLFYQQLSLPFLGEWMVSQGYDGNMTHKGDWSKALDFVILDTQMKTYELPGSITEHFYCYNKPILSPADGIVEEIVDHIDDNNIGGNNTQQNWGNSIVIKHGEGLYTKMSHLKKHSFQVSKGSYVKKGAIVAYCGNSGRSPEPHLHFQVQSTPYIGSKTIAYPFTLFNSRKENNVQLKHYSVPEEGSFVSNLHPNEQLQQAFNFQPGFVFNVAAAGFDLETWEVCTSIYNETYLYCSSNNTFAYFVKTENVFYFTNYFGSKKTLLYYFYLAAYKVVLSTDVKSTVIDFFPLNISNLRILKWVQDMVAPFFIFIKIPYTCSVKENDDGLGGGTIQLESSIEEQNFGISLHNMKSQIIIKDNRLLQFNIITSQSIIEVTCTN